jgi:hypothetical protein
VRKLNTTKRDRQKVIQAWLDPNNYDENEVLKAVNRLSEKHNMTTKAVIMKSILWAAQQDGIEVDRPVSMTQITRMFKTILGRVDNLVTTGAITNAQASELTAMFENEGVQFEDLDPVSRSLANNYTGFTLNEDEDDE